MFYSADVIPRAEALAVQKRLAALLRYKLKREYSEMCGFVKAWISIAIGSSNSLILHSHSQHDILYIKRQGQDHIQGEGGGYYIFSLSKYLKYLVCPVKGCLVCA